MAAPEARAAPLALGAQSGPPVAGRPGERRMEEIAAGWLSLAAAPTFLAMAVWTDFTDGTGPICSASSGPWPLGGMTLMYALMGLFHLPVWLKRRAGRY